MTVKIPSYATILGNATVIQTWRHLKHETDVKWMWLYQQLCFHVDLSLYEHASFHSANGTFRYLSPFLQPFVSTTHPQKVTLRSLCFIAAIVLHSAHCKCNSLQYYQFFFKDIGSSTTILHLLHHNTGSCNPHTFSQCWYLQCHISRKCIDKFWNFWILPFQSLFKTLSFKSLLWAVQ